MPRLAALPTVVVLAAVGLPADAGHGAWWIARGAATAPDDLGGGAFPATLHWDGSFRSPLGRAEIEIRSGGEPDVILHRDIVLARSDVGRVFFEGCVEVVDPYTIDSTVGNGALLHVTGIMRNDLCDFFGWEHDYTGLYLGRFALDLHMRGADHG